MTHMSAGDGPLDPIYWRGRPYHPLLPRSRQAGARASHLRATPKNQAVAAGTCHRHVGSRGCTQDGSGETAQEWLYTSSFGNAGESPGRPAAETQFEKPHGLNYGNTPKHDPLRTRAYLRKYALGGRRGNTRRNRGPLRPRLLELSRLKPSRLPKPSPSTKNKY